MINLGKWYDPISERWVAPREHNSEAPPTPATENHVVELQRTVEIERIWRALVDCCASK